MSPAPGAAARRPRAPALREAEERDLDALQGLYRRLAEHHAPGPRFALAASGAPALCGYLADRLADPDARLLVADEAGELSGFCLVARLRRPGFFSETRRAEIAALFVRPERRRSGLGRALVDAALSALDPAGTLRVELAVDRDNPEAAGFWRALGFAPAMDVLERRR